MVDETINEILDPTTSFDERVEILVRQILLTKTSLKFDIDHGLEPNARDKKMILYGLTKSYFIFTAEKFTEDKELKAREVLGWS